jgi:alkanesulfonate monooxygenase SsuD/methylene tetrahydromethanopterin reductase-like flavin-dependent oxidoreductase (luciferase family)
MTAIEVYRSHFQPSPRLERPFVMLGANVIAADTDAEAQLLLTSLQQVFVQLRRGRPGPLPPPQAGFESQLLPHELAALEQTLACAFVGSTDTVRAGLEAFIARTGADELILAAHVHDHAARLRSYELVSTLR